MQNSTNTTRNMQKKVHSGRRRIRRIWRNCVSVMACVVVFCVTYALILPAITMEKDTFCGVEAHVHEDQCYEGKYIVCDPAGDTELPVLHTHDAFCYDGETLICTLAELAGHIHTDGCYEIVTIEAHSHTESCHGQVKGALICTAAEDAGHTHTDACYVPGETLICAEEEREGHFHGEACYAVESRLTCTLAEGEGHSHSDGCYATENTLICTEEHTHGEGCYTQTQKLVCTTPEEPAHAHAEGCYTETKTLICQIPEDPGHVHANTCYEQVLNCGEEEREGHTHTDACYEMVDTIVCGKEESAESVTVYNLVCTQTQIAPHTHDGSCSDENGNLICTIQNAIVHQHTEACVQPSQREEDLICELQVHEHTLICYSDPSADLETAEDWEKTFADLELSGDWRRDVLAIAQTQLGYEESTKNYIVEGDNPKGYTRYGDWYGIPYGDWCAMFVSFCLDYAGVEGMPLDCNCPNWIRTLTEAGLYHNEKEYVPAAGDLIFFDWNADGSSDHVGIVAEFTPAGEDTPATVRTIEGNSGNCVKYNGYAPNDTTIMGYGTLVVSEEVTLTTLTATIYTDGTYLEPAQDDTVITVTGDIPATAEVRAYAVENPQGDLDTLFVYDIEIFLEDGSVYVHEGDPLSVNFSSPEIDALCNGLLPPEVYYIPETGEPEQMDTVVEDGNVRFETSHFSTYALVRPQNAIQVDSQEALIAAWETVLTAKSGTIQLTGDIQVNAETALVLNDANANITVDLNGKTLTHTGSASLFQVQNGTLTVGDSAPAEETEENLGVMSVNDLGAHVATTQQQNGKVTLTYYITESEVIDEANGDTEETLYKHTVTGAGTVLTNASAPVFRVTGGTLNIDSGMYCGGTERAIYQTGGTANLLGGYICGFTRANPANINAGSYSSEVEAACGGAVWASGNGVALNVSGTVLAGNKAASGGAIFAKNGKVTIDGGIISGNESAVTGNNPGNAEGLAHFGGGGMIIRGNTEVVMTGGYITNNLAHSVCYWDGGGGVLLDDTSTMTVTGGYLTGNEAASGGAIRTNWQRGTFVSITDGYFCANYGRSAEGGAISISQNAEAIILGGYFNNNRTDNVTHWGGGAIFGANGSQIYMLNVLIAGNDAAGFGGGVAGCSTGRVQVLVKQGGAVFNNTAAGDNMSGSTSDKREDTIYAYGDPVFMANGYQDFFCALNSTVDGSMLGNNSANWTGSSDGKPVAVAAKEILQSAYVAGLTSHPTADAIADAQSLAKVYINGNFSNTHGGGILCNGYLLIGEPESVTLSSRIELIGSKVLVNEHGQYLETDEGVFKFEITDAYTGEHIAYGTNKQNGTITFDHRLAFNAPGTYTFLIKEVPMENITITYDTTRYRMTVTVKEFVDTLDSKFDDENDTVRYWYQVTNVRIEEYNGESWKELSSVDPADKADGAISINLTGGVSFTNLHLSKKDVTVVKQWQGDVPDISVTVRLYQNGVRLGEAKTLNASNGWKYTWEDLPVYATDEEGNVVEQYSYNVVEDPVEGYLSDYDITNNSTVEEFWIPAHHMANELVLGERYIVVYQDSKGINQVLKVTEQHFNEHLDATDKVVAEKGKESISYGGETIVDYFPSSQIPDRSIFRAMENKTEKGYEGTMLYNMGAGTALLLQSSGDDFLKTTSDWGVNNGWISLFEYDGTKLYGYYETAKSRLMTVTYEEEDAEFDADSNDNIQHYAKLYTLVTAGASTETVVTITNTPIEKVLYQLDLTKVSGWDHNVKLAGAVFNLLDAEGNTLSFLKEAEGAYRLSAAEGAVTDLVTNSGGKLVLKDLPEGNYLLKETHAPSGYLLMEDTEITLGGETLTLALTLEDMPEGAYELPETGGTGTYMYTMAGLMLMLISTAFLLYKQRKRRREVS